MIINHKNFWTVFIKDIDIKNYVLEEIKMGTYPIIQRGIIYLIYHFLFFIFKLLNININIK